MNRKRAGLGIAAVVIAVGALGLGSSIANIGPLAVETCVTSYEDFNLVGDSMAVCDYSPSNVKVANLTTITSGLHNGCNRAIGTSSTWNDCISSARIANLGGTRRVRFYLDANYTTLGYCVDTQGNSTTNLAGANAERISSFRNESGNC